MICSMVQTDEGPAAGRAAAWRADPDMVRGYGDDASRRSASMAICEARDGEHTAEVPVFVFAPLLLRIRTSLQTNGV